MISDNQIGEVCAYGEVDYSLINNVGSPQRYQSIHIGQFSLGFVALSYGGQTNKMDFTDCQSETFLSLFTGLFGSLA